MKILKYLTMLSAAAVMLSACQPEPEDLFSTDPVAPTLTTVNKIILNKAADGESVTFAWSAARNIAGDITYTLTAASGDISAALVEGETNLYYTTRKSDFREWLSDNLNAPDHEDFSFSLQVEATNGETVLKSESVTVEVFVNSSDAAPVLTVPADVLVLTMATGSDMVNFEWTPASIGANESVIYTLYARVEGEPWVALAAELTSTSFAVSQSELNAALLAQMAAEETRTVEFYVNAIGDSAFLDSNTATITVTTYVMKRIPVNGWSLIGVGGDWETDIDMALADCGLWVSPVTHIEGEFKIRFNHGWDYDHGAAGESALTPGTPVNVGWGGDNFNVSAGDYYVVFDEVNETICAYADNAGWGMIGDALDNGWDGDTYKLVEVSDGVFKSGAVFLGSGGFKFRKDNGWDVNFGGSFAGYGVSFTAKKDGDNISLETSNIYAYMTLDTGAETITVDDDASVLKGGWSVTGNINGANWDSDVRMYKTGNVWRSAPFHYDTNEWGFKIRKDGDWVESYGGSFVAFGVPFEATADNVETEELIGEYIYVVYDPSAGTMTVNKMKE